MSTKNQIIFLLFLQIFQLLKSDIIKRSTIQQQQQQQQQYYQQYFLQSQQLTTTPKNPFITSPDNLLARYIVKEQEHLLETEGEKPSELWLEHQRRRFSQIPTTNFITSGSKNSYNNRSILGLPIDNNNNNSNNKRQIIKTELNNESAINKNIPNNDNNVFSYTKNINKNFEIQNSESKESEESEKFNNNDKIKNKNLKNNFNEKIQIDDKIMLVNSAISHESNSRENTREKFKLNRNEKINTKKKPENFHLKTPSFKNFLEFLKSVQNGLLTKATSGIQDKISKLKELRDSILLNIEDRFGQLWIDKSKNQKNKRALLDDDDLERSTFPSTETALMTICFLTFAVFLIKLVLQVINTFKSKHYNFNGFTLNSNVEALKAVNNRKNAKYFEEDEDENIDKIAKIVSATEKYEEK